MPSEAITIFDQSRRIELRFVPLKAHHGIAWLLGDEWVIQVNAGESSGARRHTIFHEAFHIACRNASPSFKRFNLEDKQPFRELVADHFSTCFLMPREWVEERWPTVQDVKKMARIFDVSLSAMWRRLRQLDLIQSHVSY
ncbi:ImmA/IrrE family metallo-endopeptidase [Chloroflexota bacterium]